VSLLVQGPIGRHFAQFHRDPGDLVESVFTFLEAGLRSGNSILIVAGPEQVDRLSDRLAAANYHLKALRDSGQLAHVDSTRILELFDANGASERRILRAAVAPTLNRLQLHGQGIRVYSELANTLWRAGDTDGAIEVEEFWNTRAESRPFSLYCGYTMDTHAEVSYAGPLEELGRTHAEILGTPEDEEFGMALDRASKEIFGVSLTQMAGVSRKDGARRFPSGQRAMLWVTRNLPLSSVQLADRARQYFRDGRA